jgi:hypothetical protein
MFLSHYVSREEPSLETLWLRNMETMEKVQKIDRSYTAPSSKTFRDTSSRYLRTLILLNGEIGFIEY